jgi:DNA invertase Pin-like site-specific DNA recombinase
MTEPTQVGEPTKRVVTYLRVASAHQDDPAAIQAQRDACTRLAAQLGFEIAAEYVDVGGSGLTSNRPGIRRLLTDLERGPKVDYLLIQDVTRLSRSPVTHEQLFSALSRSGTKLLTTEDAGGSLARNAALSLQRLVIARAYDRDHRKVARHG